MEDIVKEMSDVGKPLQTTAFNGLLSNLHNKLKEITADSANPELYQSIIRAVRNVIERHEQFQQKKEQESKITHQQS